MRIIHHTRICSSLDDANLVYSKIFTIVAGMNGVGKTTLTNVLRNEPSDLGYIIDPDAYAVYHGGTLPGNRKAVEDINYCIENGVEFSEETTLSGNHITKVINSAKSNGYQIRLYYVGIDSADESLRRIKNRVENGGHDIPNDVVLRRYRNKLSDLLKVFPLVDYARFYDNQNGFKLIGTYENDSVRVLSSYIPEWFDSFLNSI